MWRQTTIPEKTNPHSLPKKHKTLSRWIGHVHIPGSEIQVKWYTCVWYVIKPKPATVLASRIAHLSIDIDNRNDIQSQTVKPLFSHPTWMSNVTYLSLVRYARLRNFRPTVATCVECHLKHPTMTIKAQVSGKTTRNARTDKNLIALDVLARKCCSCESE